MGDIVVYPFSFPERYLRQKPAQFRIRYAIEGGKTISKAGQYPIQPSETWTREKVRSWISFLEKVEYATFVPAIRQSTDFRSKGPVAKEKDEGFVLGRYGFTENPEPQDEFTKDFDRPKLIARKRASFGSSAYVSHDKTLIQRIIELDYRAYREKNVSIRNLIDKVASIASDITEDFPIRYVGIGEDKSGLYPEFDTPDGVVPLNVLSQGTQSILHSLSKDRI